MENGDKTKLLPMLAGEREQLRNQGTPGCASWLYSPPHGTQFRSVGTELKLLLRGIDRDTIALVSKNDCEIGRIAQKCQF